MPEPRVYDLAKELQVDSKTILDTLTGLGEPVKSASSTVEPAIADRVREALRKSRQDSVSGNRDAQRALGDKYADVGDDVLAVYWWRKAADQGDADAQNNLGNAYRDGCGVEQDDVQAVYWYRKAADQDNVQAQCALADMYASGRGIEQDDGQAVYWYQRAVDQKEPF